MLKIERSQHALVKYGRIAFAVQTVCCPENEHKELTAS
jgi:hypothetical protein